jgi:hypothetical protein
LIDQFDLASSVDLVEIDAHLALRQRTAEFHALAHHRCAAQHLRVTLLSPAIDGNFVVDAATPFDTLLARPERSAAPRDARFPRRFPAQRQRVKPASALPVVDLNRQLVTVVGPWLLEHPNLATPLTFFDTHILTQLRKPRMKSASLACHRPARTLLHVQPVVPHVQDYRAIDLALPH